MSGQAEKWYDSELGHIPNGLTGDMVNLHHWLVKAFDAGRASRDEEVAGLQKQLNDIFTKLTQSD